MGYIERLDSYKEEMISALAKSVSMPSVGGEAVRTRDGEVLPFGKGVYDALMQMLRKGKELGFDTYNDDNFAGHIEWAAPGRPASEYFGIVGHLDVVPVGEGWESDPFTLRLEDGIMYGRGTSDDKGPVVACLYAMKALKEEGFEPAMNIRLVLGCDEETGHISAEHYTENCGHPACGFTPDAEFPLINGEMGILTFDLAQKFTSKASKDDMRLTKLEGGNAHNAVPAYAKAVIAGSKDQYDLISDRAKLFRAETGYSLRTKKQGSSLVIEVTGKAAHGSTPENGLNAVSILMEFLGRIRFASEELNEFIAFYNEHIGFDFHGERLGCDLSDEVSGPLVLNVGVANINEDIANVTINIRYPVSFTGEDVLSAVEGVLGDGRIGMITRIIQPPVYRDTDDPMIEKMMEAYRIETGDVDSQPEVIGGGTYAKLFDNIVAFGAEFPDEEKTMHQANEKLSVESFMKMARIYARAIHSLTGSDPVKDV